VCFSEDEDVALVVCLRIHDRKTFLYPLDGKYATHEQGAKEWEMNFVEEVSPTSPVFVDPAACVEGIDYTAMWERVQALPSGIEIMKFSPKTSPRDVKAQDMPSAIRNKLDHHNIGHLWRVRLNKQTRARYEWDIDKAVALVMSRVEPDSE
jgi:hypothetical protein